MFRRPSKNLVVARDDLPGLFRPANQLRLEPAHAANPGPSDPAAFLPGMGEVRYANGMHSNGLQSGAADARLVKAVAASRAHQAMALAAGSPNARSRPVITTSLAQALAALPAAPEQGALQVDFAWAGNSIAAERSVIAQMYGLRPIKPFGKVQSFVTAKYGTDAAALKNDLGRQPIVSIVDIRVWKPAPPAKAKVQGIAWEHVETKQRPDGSRWIVTKADTPEGIRFAATLLRTAGGVDNEVVRTDNLARLIDAREYIRAYEVKHGDTSRIGRPARTAFWNSILRKTSGVVANGAAAATSMTDFTVVNSKRARGALTAPAAPVSGLGEIAASPLVLGGLAIAAVFFLNKSKKAS